MCELKPGPRCSNDTMKALKYSTSEVNRLTAEAKEAQEHLKFADDSAGGTIDPISATHHHAILELNQVNKGLKRAVRKAFENRLAYDASPEGLKKLETLSSVSGGSLHSYVVELTAKEQAIAGVESVHVRVPLKQEHNARLEEAKSHRESQKDLSSTLKSAEAVDPKRAVFLAKGISASLLKNMRAINSDKSISKNYREATVAFARNPTEENEKALADSAVALKVRNDRYAYLQMRHSDVDSYISKTEGKIASMAVHPTARKITT